MNRFVRGCGISLVAGGALLIGINVLLTPLMPIDQSEEVLRTSSIYLIRLSAAAVTALLLLFGCLGLHLAQKDASGTFGTIAFITAFIGNCLLFAIEWANVFVLRAVAQTQPDALESLDKSPLLNIGFASGVGLFTLGWLLLAISILQARVLPRWAAITVLAGLILIPVLTASPLGTVGSIVGSAVLGLGLAGLGLAISGSEKCNPQQPTTIQT